ncbi:MAG TPA: undecaprenyl-phosphate glucose phosphotransferase [Steroidobacteraceae bacterium]|nr:undecaprenyl-phosphate glucose phosphotransferase [Steroidobacteraceae bacterium]
MRDARNQHSGIDMTEPGLYQPVVFKKTFPIAFAALLQAFAPAAVAVGNLYWLCSIYQVDFDTPFAVSATIIAALAIVLLPPTHNASTQLLTGATPLPVSVILRWLVLLAILLAVAYMTKYSAWYSRRVFVTWAISTPILLIPVLIAGQVLMRHIMLDRANTRRVAFVGYNDASLQLARRLTSHSDVCMSVLGFFDDRSAQRLQIAGSWPLLGTLGDVVTFVKAQAADVVFIALPIRHIQRVMELLNDLRDTTASVYYVPDIQIFDLVQSRTGEIQGVPVIAMCETPFAGFRGVAKRMTDILIAGSTLVLAAPCMLVIAMLIRWTSPGPTLFKQRRYGLDGREIVVYKFRTMTVTEDGARIVQASRDDNRITPLGRFLRRYSLDELPQLINVLQGSMSLVGPRPHAVAHNELYRKLIKGYMVRHKVLPGITGLAQVNGLRGETQDVRLMEARVQYDLEYLRNWSVFLDLKILAKTAVKVIVDDKAY